MATRSGPRLRYYYKLLKRTVLASQDPASGLIPSQKYENHAWVRDNVYAVLSVWAMSLAYRKKTELDEDRARTFELEQSCVKLMRSLLMAMMQQMDKLERFKESRSPGDCLHAKYNAATRGTCVGDEEWGHLQLDATSLYLLVLAQMTAAGLQIVFNLDEVAFVQNLVFYIEDAYCIPDYGIWERGDKTNRGIRELNSSSVGLAKAALEAMSELDLFGGRGGAATTIHVLSDEAQQCDAVLTTMLPRESSSKEVDAALISVIAFPAFAVTDPELIETTRNAIVHKLQGQYGCKRFLRDGYKTAREDSRRQYYEPWELQGFENIECEWPLFFCYMIIDACFRGDRFTMDEYADMLDRIVIKTDEGLRLVPEMYAVQGDRAGKESEMPHTQPRLPIGQIPFVWAQSLYIVGRLLQDDIITPGELDPLNRRLGMLKRPDVVVQVVILAENSWLRDKLSSLCPDIQKLSEVLPFEVQPARVLGELYAHLGHSRKLGISGRCSKDVGLLATSKIYSLREQFFVFTPQNLDKEEFHLVNDVDLFVSTLRSDLAVLRSHWYLIGRPTTVVVLRERQLVNGKLPLSLRMTIKKLASGYINGTRVCLGKLSDFLSTSSFASLDFLGNYEDGEPDSLPGPVMDLLDREAHHHAFSFTRALESQVLSGSASATGVRQKPSAVAGIIKSSLSIVGSDALVPESLFLPGSTSYITTQPCSGIPSRRASVSEEEMPPIKGAILPLEQVAEWDLVTSLRNSTSLEEQGDILHYLALRKGFAWDTGLGYPHKVTVRSLFQEFYERACEENKWGLVRHFASALNKRVEDLAKSVTDLLVRQKQVTVGMPPNNEEVITRPLSTKELKVIISRAHKGDTSTAMLTQELLAYLAMFIRTDPEMFFEMQRIRVGLIIQAMLWEVARTSDCHSDDAATTLLGLSPFGMQSLLKNIISGTETEHPASLATAPGAASPFVKLSDVKSFFNAENKASGVETYRQGQWLRRRRLDGALNRVPVGFYSRVWDILDRCPGIWVRGYCLPQALTKEMTAGEFKFALRVEEMLNRVPEPEYRQLLVEALMVVSLAVESDIVAQFVAPIDVESLVQRAHGFFLEDQLQCRGNSTLCCTGVSGTPVQPCGATVGICSHFYDSAPSGCFGTMTYLLRSVGYVLPEVNISTQDCLPS